MVLEKMNGFTKWMFAAILMICGLVPLTSCSSDDDYKVHYYVELLKSGNIAIVGNSNNSATHGYPVRFVEK